MTIKCLISLIFTNFVISAASLRNPHIDSYYASVCDFSFIPSVQWIPDKTNCRGSVPIHLILFILTFYLSSFVIPVTSSLRGSSFFLFFLHSFFIYSFTSSFLLSFIHSFVRLIHLLFTRLFFRWNLLSWSLCTGHRERKADRNHGSSTPWSR